MLRSVGPKHPSKNRYEHIIPFDFNRVKLLHKSKDDDYINASHVRGHVDYNDKDDIRQMKKDPRSSRYIAAQGPRRGTVEDFWWMIWQVMPRKCSTRYPHLYDEKELRIEFSLHTFWVHNLLMAA